MLRKRLLSDGQILEVGKKSFKSFQSRLTSIDIFRYLSKYRMDALFKALNDPTRRKILELLREKDMTAGDIADCFQISKPSISHHLDLLKQADLILSEKNGQFVNYSINTSVLDECLSWMMGLTKRKRKGVSREAEKSEKRVAAVSNNSAAILRRRPALG